MKSFVRGPYFVALSSSEVSHMLVDNQPIVLPSLSGIIMVIKSVLELTTYAIFLLPGCHPPVSCYLTWMQLHGCADNLWVGDQEVFGQEARIGRGTKVTLPVHDDLKQGRVT